MILNDLPRGALVFIDANIFVYHFSGVSAECRTLLKRVERKELRASTGAHIILEVLHRLMTIEAISKGLITPGQPAKKLKQNPDVIKQLLDYAKCVSEIGSLNIRVHPVTARQIRISEAIRSSCGMMTNDSVTAAMMSSYGITKVASLDSDLQRAAGISLYRPTDVP
jgi:predicted nucleic acid-binding protein